MRPRAGLVVAALAACGAPLAAPVATPALDAGPADVASGGVDAAFAEVPDGAGRADAFEAADVGPDAADASDAALSFVQDADASIRCTERTLPVAAPNASCTRDDQCMLASRRCCPTCGRMTLDEVRAIATGRPSPYCPAESSCPRCMSAPPLGVRAACDRGTCVVKQRTCAPERPRACPPPRPARLVGPVLPEPLSRCAKDSDCRVRGVECCWCGELAHTNAVAVRADAAFPCRGVGDCLDCVQADSSVLTAVCVAGRCRVRDEGAPAACRGAP